MNWDGMAARLMEISRAIPNMAITPEQIKDAKYALGLIHGLLEMKEKLISAPKFDIKRS